MSKSVAILFAVIALDSALTILTEVSNIGLVGGGPEIVPIGRIAVGVLGLASVGALFARPATAWVLALVWAVVQIPIYAWTPSGSPNQLVLSLFLGGSSSSSVNGILTSYTQIGVNVAGIIFLGIVRAWRERILSWRAAAAPLATS